LATEPDSSSRFQDRHSHINIRLQYRANGQWQHVQALGWNERGFNFFQPEPIDNPQLELKRGLTLFEGTIVWRATNTDVAVVRETLVNELIFKHARNVVHEPAVQARLLKLIRVPGMVEQKRKILASLGLDIPDARLAQLVATRKQERPLIHYGVKVESETWAGVVANALSVSEVVISLDQWSKALG